MIERDMEDLIAAYPDDFFPRKHFVLVGRQQSFADVGRFDLLFKDEFGYTILMELKAVTLKYDDATQVAKYRDELKRRGCKNIVMWLVAPHVPGSVREFLDDKGIEYTEIHVNEFRRVAEQHDFAIKSEREPRTTKAGKDRKIRQDVVQIGELLLEEEARQKHIDAGYKNFEDYVERVRGYPKSSAFEAMKIVRELTRGQKPLAKEDVRHMTRKNAIQLIKLKNGGVKITPQIIAAAKNMTEKQFREYLRVGALSQRNG